MPQVRHVKRAPRRSSNLRACVFREVEYAAGNETELEANS